ncbi:NADP-dependent phosphogluconate dehydrogenase [Desulfomicrobium orale]|uniref:6-phosphogluconate dehydrogenase, decarboxylating n=1 Tax=Desulfomicrobium orale DSM 12838 TaxID=888061 RepID=A0A0X8JQ49_9BACT|nr:NADP-dependent phosphogluconate dehydrogenase [Desulfomicrobium orale]AMD92912.1 hypothetical protein AXF15_07220 [Desulfomicrobium orale DSM 12838]
MNDIALIGLAVMGQNLVLNMARNGLAVTVYNRTRERTEAFLGGPAKGQSITPAWDVPSCVAALSRPRKIILMVKAGTAVDQLLDELLPVLEPGDIVVDGGNSHFEDTVRRTRRLRETGVFFAGMGVSGGEEGALLGPSLMPGGPLPAWEQMRHILEKIAARSADGDPCADYMGADGAGHFVKMVHNGIEYAVMQLIAETWDLLRRGLNLSPGQTADCFAAWNKGAASSYLLEITANILRTKDLSGDGFMVDAILDTAQGKGTGLWTSQSALNLGVPVPAITAAVEARMLSMRREERQRYAPLLPAADVSLDIPAPETLGKALFLATRLAYLQGFSLLMAAERTWNWGLDPARIARVWRAGCIIRAAFLDDLVRTFAPEAPLSFIASAPEDLADAQLALRRVTTLAAAAGIPAPGLGASLAYYDAFRSARLPASLVQAQRDYFGAHGFERPDRPGVFHGPWKG